MSIAQRYKSVREQVDECCRLCGRDPREVTLVAVSKTVDEIGVEEAFSAGAREFGENRPDQIVRKSAVLPEARWHFIGNIQSRRIDDIVSSASLIHSLHQMNHAVKIDSCAAQLGIVQDVLLEVNVSGEESKSGIAPADALDFARECAVLPHIRLRGLMTMAPQGDLRGAFDTFEGLARLAEDVRGGISADEAAVFNELSMGMSEDWREGVRAGATIVRVGRAIFSDSFE